MNKKIVFGLSMLGILGLASVAFAQSVTIPNPIGSNSFGELLTKIASGVGTLVATLGVIAILWAGILYLTSGGSPEKMGRAKTALTYAIIGIVVGLAAKVIVNIVKQLIS